MHFSSLSPVLLLLLISVATAGPYISEIYPDTWLKGDDDEYVMIRWDAYPGQISLTDGEGTVTLTPPVTGASGCTIARKAEAFRDVWGWYPDYELVDSAPSVPEPMISGRFQLANKKDELALMQNGRTIQQVSWPGDLTPRQGQVHYAGPDGIWNKRVLMAGGSRFEPASYLSVSGFVFVSPDCSRDMLKGVIARAEEELLVNVYEFTDLELASLLSDAAQRGVRVSVLLEGGPVGGIPPEEFPVIHELGSGGARVMLMEGSDERHPPYRYNHAKYLVADRSEVLLTTENFKQHSLPPAGTSGNRGWGVLLQSPEVAEYFSLVFLEDSSGPWIEEATGRTGDTEQFIAQPYTPVFTAQPFAGAEVIPVLSPDTSLLIADMIDESRERVWIAQAYIKEYPGDEKNPFLAAAVDAARRGVDVRILLDGYYYNIEGDKDNDELVTALKTLGASEDIPLQAKILYPEQSGLLKLHAKGVIADDQVLVSSMNWNENSACFNREAGVIIRSKVVASYFASVFLADWAERREGIVTSKETIPEKRGFFQVIALAGVFVFLILLYRRRQR